MDNTKQECNITLDMVKELGSKNMWLRDNIDYPLSDEDYQYCLSIVSNLEELKKEFEHGNWAIRQAFAYKDLVFIQQVNGGDEYLTATIINDKLVSFESISWGAIIEKNEFDKYWEQCQESKEEIISHYSKVEKTMEDWEKSNVDTFEKFFSVGDRVSDDVVQFYRNIAQPITDYTNYVQAGGSIEDKLDIEENKYKPTFITFYKEHGDWVYKGDCFQGKWEVPIEQSKFYETEEKRLGISFVDMDKETGGVRYRARQIDLEQSSKSGLEKVLEHWKGIDITWKDQTEEEAKDYKSHIEKQISMIEEAIQIKEDQEIESEDEEEDEDER